MEFFFWKYFLGMQLFYICPHVPVDIIRVFFYFRFSNRKSQSQQKLAKKITHCTIQLHAKNLTYFFWTPTHLILKAICSHNAAKTFDFTTFPANMFLFGVIKDICTTVFLDAQEPHSWSNLKPNVCIFPYISVKTCLFQRRSKILLLGLDWWEAE